MRGLLMLVALLAVALVASPAQAQLCSVLIASVAPASAPLSTYSPIGTPAAYTVGVQVTNNAALPCQLGVTFSGPVSPAVMTWGGSQLAYTIKDASDTTTLLYTGALPGSNFLPITAPVGTSTHNVHVTAVTGQFSAAAGSYLDTSVSVQVWTRAGGLLLLPASSATLTVSATVTKICSIGGTIAPGADSATIAIGAGGSVNTAPIVRSYANAICNAATNVTLSSANGGVKATAPAAAGFSNVIGYSASATLSGATATLNTATASATTGVIFSPGGASGNISLTITPQASALPLLAGGYADVLSIVLTPQ